MNNLKKAIIKANSSLSDEIAYTFDFTLVQLDAEHEANPETEWSVLPSVNRTFGTLPIYSTEEAAMQTADKFLDRQLAVALANGYRLIVAPKHIYDEHHEYCAFCHVRAKMDAPSIVIKVRLHPIMAEFDPWMF